MKLQKQLSRVVDNKEYAKWIIVIPPSTIEKVGWTEGQLLKNEVKDGTLHIRPLNKKEIESTLSEQIPNISYEDFKNKIKNLLEKNPIGLTWTEIREMGNFSQKVPNNKWVRQLEKDISLNRRRDRNRGIIWKLS